MFPLGKSFQIVCLQGHNRASLLNGIAILIQNLAIYHNIEESVIGCVGHKNRVMFPVRCNIASGSGYDFHLIHIFRFLSYTHHISAVVGIVKISLCAKENLAVAVIGSMLWHQIAKVKKLRPVLSRLIAERHDTSRLIIVSRVTVNDTGGSICCNRYIRALVGPCVVLFCHRNLVDHRKRGGIQHSDCSLHTAGRICVGASHIDSSVVDYRCCGGVRGRRRDFCRGDRSQSAVGFGESDPPDAAVRHGKPQISPGVSDRSPDILHMIRRGIQLADHCPLALREHIDCSALCSADHIVSRGYHTGISSAHGPASLTGSGKGNFRLPEIRSAYRIDGKGSRRTPGIGGGQTIDHTVRKIHGRVTVISVCHILAAGLPHLLQIAVVSRHDVLALHKKHGFAVDLAPHQIIVVIVVDQVLVGGCLCQLAGNRVEGLQAAI